jgi:trans-aconitate 2-methyltransferase
MATWDPQQYLTFAGERARPALDLLGRIRAGAPATVFDLGCGAGNVTRVLAERWPGARVTGVDSSAAMLERARAAAPDLEFVARDLASWTAPAPASADVVFSNAALHWLDDHPALFARLMAQLAPGGTLAVQMPRNHGAASHSIMLEAAHAGPWRARLARVRGIRPVHEPAAYYRMLAPLAARLDIWETEYLHVLEGEDPVVAWTRGTGLRPYLDALDEEEQQRDFLSAYAERIARAYPPEPDGRTLFRFRRTFIVAER